MLTSIGKIIAGLSDYFKKHELLIVLVVAAVLVWGISGKIEDAIAAHDKRVYDAAELARQAQADANLKLAAMAQANAANYQKVAQQALEQNAKLAADNRRLLSELARRQDEDRKLPPPQLAARIEGLSGQTPGTAVTPKPDGTFSVTQPGAVSIAQTLEKVPALEGQLANAKTEKENVEKQVAAADTLITSLNVQVVGLKSEITKTDNACKAEVKAVKAKAAKGKRKWFVAGFASGLAVRTVVYIFTGK